MQYTWKKMLEGLFMGVHTVQIGILNLMRICQIEDEIKLVYCLAQKVIPSNETAITLTKVVIKEDKISASKAWNLTCWNKQSKKTSDITKMAKNIGKFKI